MLLLRNGRAGDNGVRAPVNSLVVGESGADAEMEGRWKGTPAAVTGAGRGPPAPASAWFPVSSSPPRNHKELEREQERRRSRGHLQRKEKPWSTTRMKIRRKVDAGPTIPSRVLASPSQEGQPLIHPRGDFPSQHSMGVSPQGFHTPSQLEWGWFSRRKVE
jgi:hypothetical protein